MTKHRSAGGRGQGTDLARRPTTRAHARWQCGTNTVPHDLHCHIDRTYHRMSARDYFLDEAEEAGYDGPGYGPGADAEGHDAETASDREFIEIEEENPLCAAAQLEPCA